MLKDHNRIGINFLFHIQNFKTKVIFIKGRSWKTYESYFLLANSHLNKN